MRILTRDFCLSSWTYFFVYVFISVFIWCIDVYVKGYVHACACVCIWRPEMEVAQPRFLIYGFSLNLELTNWVRLVGPKHQWPSYFASPVLGLMALGILNVIARNPNSDLDACIASFLLSASHSEHTILKQLMCAINPWRYVLLWKIFIWAQ